MGVPVAAAYILQVAFVIPALVAVGVDVLTAHLFVVYFCSISMITPPVALTSYVAASIAESNVMKTSIQATALGISAYIIPYIFVFHPALLLNCCSCQETLQISAALCCLL
ncbi:MAG: TRAP transporter large permease subunit [Bacillota bacterium]